MNSSPFTPFTEIPIKSKQISYYLSMVNDAWRNKFFRDALYTTAKDKVVLDIGSGTGILSAYALSAGAKFVFAVERNAESANITNYTLSKCFDQSRFKVINCDFWTDAVDQEIDQEVDILVSETVGPNLFDQGMAITWHCAKTFLSKNAISIPDRLHCDLHMWNGEKNTVHKVETQLPSYRCNLYPTEVLMDDFAQALIDYDRESQAQQELMLGSTLQQSNFKLYNQAPDHVYKDIVSVTMDTLPPMEFDKHTYPNHISTEIKFAIDIDSPKTIGIINKISFRDNTLFLQDAMYMPWKYSPSLVCATPGTYEFFINKVFDDWQFNIINSSTQ